jgi:hypothetical protein
MLCSKCGSQNEDGAIFCQSCGAKQEGDVQSQQGVAIDQNGYFNFNGKQFSIDSIDDVVTAGDTGGISYSGLLVAGKYTAYIKITFKDSTPEEVCTFGGSSVMGIGSRGSAMKDYEMVCQELFQAIGMYMVRVRAQKIIDGTPIEIAASSISNHASHWALRSDGIVYHRGFREKVIQRGDFSRCILKKQVFHIYTNSGKQLRQPATIDLFENLCLPEVMSLLY